MKKNIPETFERSSCAISKALEIVGDRWSLLILRDLMFTPKRSYSELQTCGEKIATNILASRLSMLEANGIVVKTIDPENKRKVLYHLTMKGIDLLPVIMELKEWMKKYSADTTDCPNQPNFENASRKKVLKEFRKKLKKEHLTTVE
ncbi:MAG: helix-turn-helix transcriptional regulator [Rhizobacter sp.]|nr:helix-turn-helix transcriptional regulator [Ferruginibacter sp.]